MKSQVFEIPQSLIVLTNKFGKHVDHSSTVSATNPLVDCDLHLTALPNVWLQLSSLVQNPQTNTKDIYGYFLFPFHSVSKTKNNVQNKFRVSIYGCL